ncbi:alanine--tRNA ligase [Acidobacteriota bacterium]
MKAQEIREKFIEYFSRNGHKIVKSSSLQPKDDPTLLFTNAGMNQFKDIFLGLESRTYKRATSVQKCMRVSGKHNDLETVGTTNKHHTFFEMLGNFSFGDYFKKEAIEFAWELFTDVFKMDKNRLYFTVYEEDDEAYKIWEEGIGISEERIFRLGKKDNYWAMGETGPCGPCSEIHIDLEPDLNNGDPCSLIVQGHDRFLELWNLVFMQYFQDEKGQIHELPSPSIDTGMGLERVATVLQEKKNNFETDLFSSLTSEICNVCETDFPTEEKTTVALRVIADHIRAVTFLIGDGIMPSNDGRGYVLRRLIRRAFRQGNTFGVVDPFLYKLVGQVVDIMKDAYPELLSSTEYISKVCLSEERRFALTLTSGLKPFNQFVQDTKQAGQTTISGQKVFKLYDTFGFPLDLSKELASEKKLSVDESGFLKELEKQRQRARLSWKGEAKLKEQKSYEGFKDLSVSFVGYEQEKVEESSVLALMKNGHSTEELVKGDLGEIILDKTSFYAEAGGQIGDSGILQNPHFSALVENTFFPIPGLISHKVKVISGKLHMGDVVEASIDSVKRRSISKNHTATHLLHASLRQILGDHIKQAGSLVSPNRFRFDFTHFSSLSGIELRQIETLINEKIQHNITVQTQVMALEEGLKSGATAIFEEKYGEKVRMVTIGDFSKELCGGVHVQRTGEIGLFKIMSETSIAAGMRRIEAITGAEAVKYTQDVEKSISDIQFLLNSPRKDILLQIEKLQGALKENEKEIREIKQKLTNAQYEKDDEKIRDVQGISLLTKIVRGLNNSELRLLADSLKQKIGSGIVILGAPSEKKVFLVIAVTKDLVHRIQANELIKDMAPLVGGGGGGRPDFAQAGGTKPEVIEKVLNESPSYIEGALRRVKK